MQPILLFPAMNYGNLEIYFSAKSIDKENVLFIYNPSYVEQITPEGNYLVDDFASVEKLIKKIEKWITENNRKVGSIISLDDERQFKFSKQIADWFKIECYSEETFRIASNKWLMKKEFVKNNVPTAKFKLISENTDLRLLDLNYPNVLKIISGNGSEYVFKNDTLKELETNIKKVKESITEENDTRFKDINDFDNNPINPKTELIVEEFIGGEEFSLDFCLKDGTINILRVIQKYNHHNFGYFSAFYLLNKNTLIKKGIYLPKLEEIARKIADSLKINQGVCMIDFKVEKGEVVVIETNIRPGFSTFIPLMYKLYGYTSIAILSKIRLGQKLGPLEIKEYEGLAINLFAKEPGIITKMDLSGIEKLKTELKIIDMFIYNQEGDNLSDSETSHHDLLVGCVYVKNPPKDKIEEIINKIHENVKINVTR